MVTIASNGEWWNDFGCDCWRLERVKFCSLLHILPVLSQCEPKINNSGVLCFVMSRTARAHMNHEFRLDWLQQMRGCWDVSEGSTLLIHARCKSSAAFSRVSFAVPRGLNQHVVPYQQPFIPACVQVKRRVQQEHQLEWWKGQSGKQTLVMFYMQKC